MSLYRTTNLLVRELDGRLGRTHNATFVQAVTLLAVDSFACPQPHLVSDYLSQKSQTVAGVLDRLQHAGHLTRHRDLADRRAVRLQLTSSGRRLVATVKTALADHLSEVVAALDAQSQRGLTEELAVLERSARLAESR